MKPRSPHPRRLMRQLILPALAGYCCFNLSASLLDMAPQGSSVVRLTHYRSAA
jgi:hypothetical protein